MKTNDKPTVKYEANSVFSMESTGWRATGYLVGTWLVVSLCFQIYCVLNLLSFLLKIIPARDQHFDYCVLFFRDSIHAVIQVIFIKKHRHFRTLFSDLLRGKLSLGEERRCLKKRIIGSVVIFLLGVLLNSTLNLTESIISLRVKEFRQGLVDKITFGRSESMDDRTTRIFLLLDSTLFTLSALANFGMWVLCGLFSLTVGDGVRRFRDRLSNQPVMTASSLKECHTAVRTIQGHVRRLDGFFSVLLFMWYFEALVSGFNGILYFLEGSLGLFSSFYAAFIFFQPTVAVLILTYVVSRIPDGFEEARDALRDTVTLRSEFDLVPLELYLMSKRMASRKNGLTAAGFFLINKSVCLSFIGFLVTYLVVLYSSGAKLS